MAIHRNFSSLARSLRRTGADIVNNAERAIKRAAIAAYSTLIVVTPVDSGRARAGWIVSFGAPVESDVGATDGSRIGISPFRNRALSTINAWTLARGSLFVSNSVEYIEYLDDGHSSQRPEGMTIHGVEAAKRVLRSARMLRR